ncbi:MAG: AraC family transcriptional regulator [Clostridia bacterium]|nr:AraC family transcriptional regulator [Clostridia bacterium]
MDYIELDKQLKKLNSMEKKLKGIIANNSPHIADKMIKMQYSCEYPDNDWVINSRNLMEKDQSISIHKHDRFVRFDEHRHDYIEMIYVYSGNIEQTINGRNIKVNSGEIFILDLNVAHAIQPAMEQDIAVNILMRREFFDWMFLGQLSDNDIITDFIVKAIYDKKGHKRYLHFHCSQNEKIQNIMKDLLCEFYSPGVGASSAIQAYMILIFTELLREHKNNMSIKSVDKMNDQVANSINQFIRLHYKNATLKDIAQHFNFSTDYMGRLIKQITGKNFTDLLQKMRLKQAGILLKNSQRAVSDIANEVGYTNISYFYRLFKQEYKMTPDDYRNR